MRVRMALEMYSFGAVRQADAQGDRSWYVFVGLQGTVEDQLEIRG